MEWFNKLFGGNKLRLKKPNSALEKAADNYTKKEVELPSTAEVVSLANPKGDLKVEYKPIKPLDLMKVNYQESPNKSARKGEVKYIVLHHTAGWDNPFDTVEMWENDERGRIGTHYVIGGVNPVTGNYENDGVIVQCVKDEHSAFHLGINQPWIHKTIGIELCNLGYLRKTSRGFISWAGNLVAPEFVCDLDYEFHGFQHFQHYSSSQIESLRFLVKMLAESHNINVDIGLRDWISVESPKDAFGYRKQAYFGTHKGIISHSNVRADKSDLSPQDLVIDMLQTL